MAAQDSHQTNDFSAEAFSRYIPRQPPNPALENGWLQVPPPVNNRREDIPPQDTDRRVIESGRMQYLHHIDMAYQGGVDYYPQPLANPTYVFPDVGHAHDIPVQVQPDAPLNQEHNPFDHIPPHVAPGLVEAAFPHPFVHRIHTPDPPPQAGAGNLRQLTRHYLHHPDAQVRRITMEAGSAGRIKVAVIFETPDF